MSVLTFIFSVYFFRSWFFFHGKSKGQRLTIHTLHAERNGYAIPQRSILDSLLLNIFLYDLSYLLEGSDIANYANDTTP